MNDLNTTEVVDSQTADTDTGDSPSLLSHLAELRSRLIKAFLSIIPGFAVAYGLAGQIIELLARPLKAAMPNGPGLIATGLPDTFFVHLKIGLWGGLFISAPYWLYQLWAFVAPGLYQQERKAAMKLSGLSFILLVSGAAFAYFAVFPIAFKFFVGFSTEDISLLPTIRQYLSMVTAMLLAFGGAFQLPLLLLFLNSVGLIDAEKLIRFRSYAIVLIVILAAIMTPPDVISQILMAIPMITLYEISILMIKSRLKIRSAETAGAADNSDQP